MKSNIGHLEAAAGIAGAIKVLLCLKHKTLVKNLHGTPINSHIDLQGTPFYLPQVSAPWAVHNGKPRMAGLSSFGIGGTNAHLLFEEFSKEHTDE
ncbi:Polyketide synthase PksN [compost metagenome]